jgi:hypothetical protein
MNPPKSSLVTTAHPDDWVALRVVMDHTCFIWWTERHLTVANRLTVNSLAEYAEKVPAANLSDLILSETGF